MSTDKNLEKNVLIQLLKTLSEDEWKEFEKFVSSSYFNKGRNYIPLLKQLKKYYPDFNSPDLTKESLYKKLFKGNQYKESVLNSMLSRLYNIGEEFLSQVAFNNNGLMLKEKLAISELRARGLNPKAIKLLDEMKKAIGKRKIEVNNFAVIKEFNRELSFYYHQNSMRDKLVIPLTDSMRYSLYNFLTEFFIDDISMESQKNFWKSDFRKGFVSRLFGNINVDEILKMVKKDDEKNYNFLYLLYLYSIAMRNPDNDESYKELKSLVFSQLDSMEHNMKKVMMNGLSRLCSLKFVSGKNEYKKEAFEIKKKSLEENLFIMNYSSYFQTSEFRSVFLEALNVNEIEWAEEFSKKFINRLHPDFRKDIENYCIATLANQYGNFKKAVDYAVRVNINQITFKLDMKNLLSRIYYDTESTEPLISLLNSYYQLVKNSESRHDEFLSRHLNFVKFMRRLLNIRLNGNDKTELALLKKDLVNQNVTSKSWLLIKVSLVKTPK